MGNVWKVLVCPLIACFSPPHHQPSNRWSTNECGIHTKQLQLSPIFSRLTIVLMTVTTDLPGRYLWSRFKILAILPHPRDQSWLSYLFPFIYLNRNLQSFQIFPLNFHFVFSQGLHHRSQDPSVSSGYLHFEMGDLRRCLNSGEYGALKDCDLYESNFLQVKQSGKEIKKISPSIYFWKSEP